MKESQAAGQDEQPSVRPLDRDDLECCLELSTEAGWNQTENDWRLLLQMCDGYGIDVKGHGLAGTTMAWKCGDKQAWVNMVLVAKAFRGRGFATKLMNACLEDLATDGRSALLDATDTGRQVYSKLGFSGDAGVLRLYCESLAEMDAVEPLSAEGISLEPMQKEDLEDVAALDRQVVGISRESMLADFFRRSPKVAWIARDASGSLQSFILGRDGRNATQLGPIVAESSAYARILLLRSIGELEGLVIIDVPNRDAAWLGELKHLGFAPQRSFVRMGNQGATLETDWSKYHAIGGPDFA